MDATAVFLESDHHVEIYPRADEAPRRGELWKTRGIFCRPAFVLSTKPKWQKPQSRSFLSRRLIVSVWYTSTWF